MRLTAKDRVRGQALFYRPNGDKNEAWAAPFIKQSEVHAVLDKLAAYEDAEEQGLLVRMPCDVGNMVYYRRGRYVIGDVVRRIIIDEFGNRVVLDCHNKEFDFEDFGKTAFLTRAEAEATLNGGQDDV